ncbi:Mrp/NBP35 family ATP-binding protein [Methanonatronarchaeum sp. AMET-Sl]|uniref:Mrp/NBP35 family ATP-binding protein n=1 Tax=Methanonatronarchaeum sp. AMET-Sl TaxID=3037654 RepID=UPI00244E2413|nr:Mrp/NBP35 family ATP-binding protein [Methanonatronarchaeum sp. AMET-Sl]WGI17481.1 Mrp/NBP35 family ATP-binding protein [Methanonatronarchaeum sp. AMET-Sl]
MKKTKQKNTIKTITDQINKSIVVMSGKGGVGKSTVAANIAMQLSNEKNKVGLMDCDIHGPSIPKIIGAKQKPTQNKKTINPIETETGIKTISIGSLQPETDEPVIWRGPLKMKAIEQFFTDVNWGKLDYLIFDLPPGTGDEPLTIAQILPNPDGTVIVTTPQEVALQTIRKSVKFAEKVNLPIIGLIENMSGFKCPNCQETTNIFGSGGGKKLALELEIPFLGKIPLDPEIMESGEQGNPIVNNKKSKTSKQFQKITDQIKNKIK